MGKGREDGEDGVERKEGWVGCGRQEMAKRNRRQR